MKRTLAVMFSLALTFSAVNAAAAQDVYPNKLVKLVIPFSPGGSTDLLARSLAERLTETWKQPVIIENRPGASGAIGSAAVAKATPDGYTLLMGTATTQTIAPALNPKLPYDVSRDFVAITELVKIPQLLSVNAALPIYSVRDLVAYAKSKPGELTHGGNTGSGAHMAMELLASRAGFTALHVPYKGSGPTMVDLQGGQLNAGFDVIMTTLPLMKGGRLRVLAVTSAKRSPLLPQVPTVAESGYPGFEASIWFGLLAPANTPPSVVNKISEDSRRILAEPAMRAKLEAAGFEIVASSPAEFSKRLKEDAQQWRKVIVDNKIKPE